MKKALLACAALGLVIPAVPAMAADVSVRTADLNLATKAGQATLQTRIDAAARQACEVGNASTGTRMGRLEAKRCVTKAKKLVEKQLRNQIAAAAEQQRLGG